MKLPPAGEATERNKLVFCFDFGRDGKLAKTVAAAFCAQLKDKALLLVSADEDSNRFLVFAMAPKGGDVDCKAWINTATTGFDGKGGGKKDTAQANVPDVSLINGVIEKAKQF